MPKTLKRFIETYRGSSFPTRCETEDGDLCVLKMHGAGNGAESMLSEFLVNRIASQAGVSVPDAFVVEIPAEFPWNFGTDEFYDLVRKSPAANLGLVWIEGAQPMASSEYNELSDEIVSQVVTLDLTFANWDRSAKSGNLLRDRRGKTWIVDHGSCRSFFQAPGPPAKTLPPGHIFAGWEGAYDLRWLSGISSPQLNKIIEAVPESWLISTHLTRLEIAKNLAARLPI
jgi:hypothetical protein